MALFKRKKRPKILIIDDSDTVRRSLKAVLNEAYQVTVAENGVAGLKQLAKEPPDLVLLDLIMPTLDGFKVLDLIRRQPATSDVPVFVITEQKKPEDVSRAMRLGATDYLKKSQVNQAMVLEKIRFFLDPELPWDPAEKLTVKPDALIAKGDVRIKNKYDVEFYEKFEGIEGSLILQDSKATLVVLPALKSVSADVRVLGNPRLTRLQLKGLRTVGGDLQILNNPVLETLADFRGLKELGGDFEVCDNSLLPATHPLKIRDMIMDAGGIGGTVTISNNQGF